MILVGCESDFAQWSIINKKNAQHMKSSPSFVILGKLDQKATDGSVQGKSEQNLSSVTSFDLWRPCSADSAGQIQKVYG